MIWFRIFFKSVPSASQSLKQKEFRKLPRGYHKIQMLLVACFLWVLKNDLVSNWDGMSIIYKIGRQQSQITVMFVVNFKKSFKVIVKPVRLKKKNIHRHM